MQIRPGTLASSGVGYFDLASSENSDRAGWPLVASRVQCAWVQELRAPGVQSHAHLPHAVRENSIGILVTSLFKVHGSLNSRGQIRGSRSLGSHFRLKPLQDSVLTGNSPLLFPPSWCGYPDGARAKVVPCPAIPSPPWITTPRPERSSQGQSLKKLVFGKDMFCTLLRYLTAGPDRIAGIV